MVKNKQPFILRIWLNELHKLSNSPRKYFKSLSNVLTAYGIQNVFQGSIPCLRSLWITIYGVSFGTFKESSFKI